MSKAKILNETGSLHNTCSRLYKRCITLRPHTHTQLSSSFTNEWRTWPPRTLFTGRTLASVTWHHHAGGHQEKHTGWWVCHNSLSQCKMLLCQLFNCFSFFWELCVSTNTLLTPPPPHTHITHQDHTVHTLPAWDVPGSTGEFNELSNTNQWPHRTGHCQCLTFGWGLSCCRSNGSLSQVRQIYTYMYVLFIGLGVLLLGSLMCTVGPLLMTMYHWKMRNAGIQVPNEQFVCKKATISTNAKLAKQPTLFPGTVYIYYFYDNKMLKTK